jgi:hypothetical protein
MTDLKFTSPSGETTIKVQDTGRLGTVAPKTQLHIKMDEPVQYETPMTEIQKVKAEIKVLEKKLSFLEELEKTKSPVEEAYKDWMGVYPPTNPSVDNIFDIRWRAFQMGYNAAYEEKVAQEPEEEPEELKTLYQMFDDEQYYHRDKIWHIVKRWMSQYADNVLRGECKKGYEYCLTVLEESLK